MYDRNPDRGTVKVNHTLLDLFKATDRLDFDVGKLLAGGEVVGTAYGSLHDPTGCPEDRAGATVLSERIVGFLLVKGEEVDTRALDEAGELSGGEHQVHIPIPTGMHALIPLGLKLLGGTGHDGNGEHLRRIDLGLFGEVGLLYGTVHLHRALGTGDVLQQIRVVLLDVVDPGGTTGGELGKRPTVLDTAKQFAALLDDGQVGTEVGVVDRYGPELAQRRVDFLGRHRPGRQAEGLGEPDPDRRGDLDDDLLLRVGDSITEEVDLILLVDGADRAVHDTLATAHTGAVIQLQHRSRCHHRPISAADELEGEDALQVLTDLDTAAALDALLGIEDDRGGGGILRPIAEANLEGLLTDAKLGSQIL